MYENFNPDMQKNEWLMEYQYSNSNICRNLFTLFKYWCSKWTIYELVKNSLWTISCKYTTALKISISAITNVNILFSLKDKNQRFF